MRFTPISGPEAREGRLGPVKMACACSCEDASVMLVDGEGRVWPPTDVAFVEPGNDLEAEIAQLAGYALKAPGAEAGARIQQPQ